MPRACSICTHSKAGEIDKALLDGVSYRNISERFGLKPTSVQRHKTGHIPQILAENVSPIALSDRSETKRYAEAKQAGQQAHALDLFSEFIRQLERVNKLSDAVDRWLQDPDDPERYSIDPRAADITVVYEDYNDMTPSGAPKRKRDSLAELLARIDGQAGVVVRRAETHVADPRDLLLKASGGIDRLGGTIAGVLDKAYNAQEVEAFMTIVLAAIAEEAPDVGARIDDNIRRRRARRGLPVPAIQ